MPASKPSQEFVPVKEIHDGVVVLKDGTLCTILMVSSLNFALKSEDEQKGIILQFQNFLNSLDFTVQIIVQSRRLDIKPYIALLEDRYKEQTNELLKIQIREYIGFIRSFTESSNIMTKTFFVTIPYGGFGGIKTSGDGIIGKLFGKSGKSADKKKEDELRFEEQRTQLEQRVNVVESGLSRCGVRSVPLGTEELVELFFKTFNPGEIVKPQTS